MKGQKSDYVNKSRGGKKLKRKTIKGHKRAKKEVKFKKRQRF